MVPTDLSRGNGHKLKTMKFHLGTGKHFYTLGVTKHWQRLL